MKKSIISIGVLMIFAPIIYGQNVSESKFSHGILFMAGGRYDNLRMCVASPAGAKGGPMADIMFITKYTLKSNRSLTFNLPLMRPVLFGLAFKMLQFEPEFTLEFNKPLNDKLNLVTGPGLGVSVHYGPDYKSNLSNPTSSFFAVGPFLSWQTGLALKKEGKERSSLGLKAFYVPLFAKNRSTGTVLGGALFYTFYF